MTTPGRMPAGGGLAALVLRDHAGGTVPLRGLIGSTPLAVVLLPGAFTPVCTSELDAIQSLWRELGARDIPLLAVSCDAPPVLAAWRRAEGIDLPLLSDFWPHGALASALEAFDECTGRAERVSVVLDADGQVAWRQDGEPGSARDMGRLARAFADR